MLEARTSVCWVKTWWKEFCETIATHSPISLLSGYRLELSPGCKNGKLVEKTFATLSPCLGQRVNHKLAPLAPGAASNRRRDMDLQALVEVECLDRCDTVGGGEIGYLHQQFIFLPAQLNWLHGKFILHPEIKNQLALPTWQVQESHLLKKFRNTSRWKWQPFSLKPPRRYPSDPLPNSSWQQHITKPSGTLGNNFWLVVGPPLWKIWKSIGMISNPIYGKIKHVPNHQPVFLCQLFSSGTCALNVVVETSTWRSPTNPRLHLENHYFLRPLNTLSFHL